jgi:hypothetical protein
MKGNEMQAVTSGIIFIMILFFCVFTWLGGGETSSSSSNSEINKIMEAKDIVRTMVNYPDTLSFHNMSTRVSGNTVTLKFTAKNAFGVPETHTMDIPVD